MTSRGNRKPANTDDELDDVTTSFSRPPRSANATLPVGELPDARIDHPVSLPAPPPADGYRVQRGAPRPVAVRIGVEDRLGPRLDHPRHHRLRHPVPDSRHA